MVSAWTFDGFIIFAVLVVCTCAYAVRIPKVKNLVLAEKHGFRGTFYKAAVLGVRCHLGVALACVVLGVYKLLV